MENEFQAEPQPPAQTGGKGWIGWVVGIALVILVGGGLFYYYQYIKISELNTKVSDLQSQVDQLNKANELSTSMADWKTYTSSKFGFSFKYPDEYKLTVDSQDIVWLANTDANRISFEHFVDDAALIASFSGNRQAKTIDQLIENEGWTKVDLPIALQGEEPAVAFLEGAAGGNNFDFVANYGNKVILISSIGKNQLPDEQVQILSTFQAAD